MSIRKRALVTGGNGFLGQHVVSRLIRAQYDVRILGRPNSPCDRSPDGIELFTADIRDPQRVEQAISGCDFVVHLVSNFRKAGSDAKEAHTINVDGTINVLRACSAAGVERLVHCSTIGVHGDVLQIPADETTPFNPGDVYQETKLAAEKHAWRHAGETGLPLTVVRPISAFGPGDRRMLKLFRMIKNRTFVMVGDGKALFQPSYIDDIADGFLLCLESPKAVGQAFIIGGEEYLSLNDMVRKIARLLDVEPPKRRLPMQPVVAAAWLCEKVCQPFGIEPPLHRRRVSFFQNNRAFRIAKAKQVLGFRPKYDVEQGFQKTIEWYGAKGWL